MSKQDDLAEHIINVFKEAGMTIDLGATYSAKGQIAQLINGSLALITKREDIIQELASALSLAADDIDNRFDLKEIIEAETKYRALAEKYK